MVHLLKKLLTVLGVVAGSALIAGLMANALPTHDWAKGLALLLGAPVLGWSLLPAWAAFGPNPLHPRLRRVLLIHAALLIITLPLFARGAEDGSGRQVIAMLGSLALLGNAMRYAFSRAAYERLFRKAGEPAPVPEPPPAPPVPESPRDRLIRDSRAALQELARDIAVLDHDRLFVLLDDIRYRYARILDRVEADPAALDAARPALIEWLPVVGTLADNFRQLADGRDLAPERVAVAERELETFATRLNGVHDRLFDAIELKVDSDLNTLNRL